MFEIICPCVHAPADHSHIGRGRLAHSLRSNPPPQEQIKVYPPTVLVTLQDDKGLDPEYRLISPDQWLTQQLAIDTLTATTRLKPQ